MKHIPMRTCIVTKKKAPKSDMIRFVIEPETGKMVLDTTGKIRSRGANLTMDLELFDEAVKRNAFERALKVKIEQDNYESARSELERHLKRLKYSYNKGNISLRVSGKDVVLD